MFWRTRGRQNLVPPTAALSGFVLEDGVFRGCSRADIFFLLLFFLCVSAAGSLLIFAVSYPRAGSVSPGS